MNKVTNTLIICLLMAFAPVSFAQSSWGDYTLIAVQSQNKATLIDNNKQTYHTWNNLTGKTGYSSYLLEGCVLLRTVEVTNNTFNGGSSTGRVQKVAKDGTILWDYTHSSTSYCLHHDICPMPNGNVLMIAYESKTAAEATQAGSSTSHVFWSEKIIEVQPVGTNGGNIVWEWHLWDHLVQYQNSSKDNYGVIADNPGRMNINYKNSSNTRDWMHANGLDYDPVLDQIFLSSHNFNEVYVIDHSTTTAQAAGHIGGNSGKGGDFLYRWGNPAAYNASGTAVLNVTHCPKFIPQNYPKGGYMATFNNGGTSTKSTVELFEPPRNGYNYTKTAGTAFTPLTSNKTYTCNGKSQNMGGVQPLPNGNFLITVAQSGLVQEIDANGNTIWSYSASGVPVKSFRYSANYVNGIADEDGGEGNVKFSVDMTGQDVNAGGVFVTGDFQEELGMGFNWEAGKVPLTREGTSNIYSTVVKLSPNTKYEYKFLNGPLFYLVEFVPEESRIGYDFNDSRWIFTGDNDTTFTGNILFGENAPKDHYMLRVKVNMNTVNTIQSNVSVKGNFERNTLQLYSFAEFAPGIYEGIVYSPQNQTNTIYKFYNGITSETVPNECASAGSRSKNVTEHTILNPVCFSGCVDCGESKINEINEENLTVFPNPGNSFIVVNFPVPVLKANISLYNIQSQKVREVEFSGTEYVLERENLPAGVYMLHIKSSELSVNKKIIFK